VWHICERRGLRVRGGADMRLMRAPEPVSMGASLLKRWVGWRGRLRLWG
jgi:hypothetical protein